LPSGERELSSYKASGLAMGHTNSCVLLVPWAVSEMANQSGCEANHSLQLSAKVMNV
jgi:hypothetical protein